eukprot:CAMPEP_0115739570 /NCGR_PEP_ID=MMETSP0272-20121206/89013_1 /TAXON_ID=71861 /ORGANISM="Scrippsiella trochoidea, Strain CCMP3099" /LENGTH=89 /DNA_ID=CAMNT_0003184131 /DNA_START=677 /DNA_END=943 /DNA_ORIENTATION=+
MTNKLIAGCPFVATSSRTDKLPFRLLGLALRLQALNDWCNSAALCCHALWRGDERRQSWRAWIEDRRTLLCTPMLVDHRSWRRQACRAW